jgi:hypothetical protein
MAAITFDGEYKALLILNLNSVYLENSPFLDGGIRRKPLAIILTHYFNGVLLIPYSFHPFMDGQ